MPFGGDLLYNLLAAGIILVVGFFLVMKAGNKIGWLIVAAAAVYGFMALKPTIQRAGVRNAAPGAGGYYQKP